MKDSHIVKIISLIFSLTLIMCIFDCQADDSIPTKMLQDIIVEGKQSWIDGEKVVFIPTKKEKNHANDIESLLRNMNMPVLNPSETGTMVDINGNPVTYYINGKPATGIDIQTFWPKDAKMVEYFANPSDPKYGGNKAVINFIMPNYKAGGVAVVKGLQTSGVYGLYQAASKIIYKRMSYGVYFSGNFTRNKTYDNEEATYHDLYYANTHYDQILNNKLDTTQLKFDHINAAFEAVYNKGATQISNTLNLTWEHYPWQTSTSTNYWDPKIFQNSAAGSKKYSRAISPTYTGRLQMHPHPQWYISGLWKYSYVSGNRDSENWTGILPPIYNASTESSHYGRLAIQPALATKDESMGFYLALDTEIQNTSIDYSGSYDETSHMWKGSTQIIPHAQIYCIPNASLDISAGANFEYWKVGDSAWTNSCRPQASIFGQWWYNNQLSLSGSYSFISALPFADNLSDAIVRQSELIWLKGNPQLKSPTSHSASISGVWTATKWLSLNMNARYSRDNHKAVTWYDSATEDMEGLIKTYKDGKPEDSFSLSVGLFFKFFANKLTFNIIPAWHYQKGREEGFRQLHSFQFYGKATYRIKKFNFQLSYMSPRKNLADGGLYRLRRSDYCNFKISYGTGALLVSAGIDNLFHKYAIHDMEGLYGKYTTFSRLKQSGRQFTVELSYFSNYGKHIEANIDTPSERIRRSGVLGAN